MLALSFALLLFGSATATSGLALDAAQFSSLAKASNLSAWDTFNQTLNGRLQVGRPVSAPCFSVVDGKNVSVDATACAAVKAGYSAPTFRGPQYGSFMNPQWETCQSASQQCLLDATNTSDPAPTQSPCFQGSVAPYFINVTGPADVQKALAFSLSTGIPLSIKNSGHDYKGRSSGKDTLSLWMHGLQSMAYVPDFVPAGCKTKYNAMTMGTGVPWETAYDFADAHNLTIIGGYQETIATGGGWVQAGGHSILSPNFGLGIDRVVQFKLVTPDGQYRIANECQNTDLFWALRGGGGGTFGVVLETTQRVEPGMALQVASISFKQNATNPQAWLRLVVDNAKKWGSEGWGGHITAASLINVTPKLTLAQANASVQSVADYALAQTGGVAVVETLPSWNAFFKKYVLAAEAAVGVENVLGTRLMPTALWDNSTGRDAVYNYLTASLQWANPYIVVGTPYLYKYTPGSTSATPAWRDSLWHLGMHAGFNWNSTLAQKTTAYQIASNLTQMMRDISPGSGAYFNEGDVYETDHEFSYWGDNYPRLLSIKQKYDPHGLLQCWQCVGWKGQSDSRYSCYLPAITPQ
ncbi:hypothetical protein BOTBODRAFT_55073 [Botryobasidium botryosum FD-172 SS1]|uniref:Uncharacterized protein n=1 Tax=Botryobasidium botryosum (strain FD-172 SS1) TaxID=930990 RepID=A0A067MTK1_BOTB1|nr:hypothetical protein BOTBODRAFT_55073 [Botryobasidium botryosum FD-172 SS1]